MLIATVIIALLLAGFFAGIETAFISANKLAIELKRKQGKSSGIILSRFQENPSRFVGSCLLGFNIFLITYGLVVSRSLQPLWSRLKDIDSAGTLKLFFEVLLSSLIVLFVEVGFKAIFRAKNGTMVGVFAPVMDLFYRIFDPIVMVLLSVASWILKYLFNVNVADPKRPFSRIDLEQFFQQAKEVDEEKSELNQELFENALSLPGIKIRNCLVPRKEIIAVDIKTALPDVVQKMVNTRMSKLLVYDGNIDNVLGYVHQLDFFKNPTDLPSVLKAIPTVPESMGVSDLIFKLTQEGKSMAWVVDEFGGTAGVVTMEDLLEEIFGEIQDEYDTDEFVEKQLSDEEFIFSGRLETDFVHEKYGLDFQSEHSETLSGFVIGQHNVMPRQGDRIIIGHYQFEILNMSDTRIELLKVKKLKLF